MRVIPEFDQPAHVGYGWNFPGAETYTVCVGVEPWYDFCVEPPCGQVGNCSMLKIIPFNKSIISSAESVRACHLRPA